MRIGRLFVLLASVGAISISGCSSIKEQAGLNRSSPDEFMVVKNAPLSMPPDYSLRPPRPGAPRPQDVAASQAARKTVFGGEQTAQSDVQPSSSEEVLLQQAGSSMVNPDIRNLVDVESSEIDQENRPVVDRLFGLNDEPGATVVNAQEERERLKRNAAEGKPITEGETPSIEQ